MPTFAGFLRLLRSLLFEDWWLKITCLGLAVLMWFYIDGELTDHGDFVATLRPADLELPSGWELSTDTPMPKFTVRLRGPRRRLQLFSPDAISIKKQSISNPQPGRNSLNPGPSDIEVESFEVLSVTPKDEKEATVTLFPTAKRTKRVHVKLAGRPRQKFVAEAALSDPDQVSIEGPAEDLDQIDVVNTNEMDINDADQDLTRELGIVPYVEVGGRRLSFRCNATVHVSVKIHPEQITRKMTLDVRPLAVSGAALSLDPKTVEVEVQAEEQDFASPDFAASLILFVEWPRNWDVPKGGATLGPVEAQVRASPPPGIQIRGLNGGPLPTVKITGAANAVLRK